MPIAPSPHGRARRFRQVGTPLVALAVAALLVGTPAGAPSAPAAAGPVAIHRAAATVPVTSSSHPYSMPTWLPIRDEAYVDCVLSNPGCGRTHTHWTMDVVLETLHGRVPRDPGVYAMGAGILHVQVAHGRACREGGPSDFGTTVWIDHGGGVVSRYGHLARILYPNGTRLAAGQRFAVMGTTGKGGNCRVPYVDFQIRTRGVSGPTRAFDTLRVCSSATSAAIWPTGLDATRHVRPAPLYRSKVRKTFTSFNQIPQRTVDLPATSSSCLPRAVPATPNAPVHVRLAPSGRRRLTVSWTRAPATPRATSVQVQLSEYHPSTRTWDYQQNEEYRTLSPASTRYAFAGLVGGHGYRATVVFRDGAGYGRSVRTMAVKARG